MAKFAKRSLREYRRIVDEMIELGRAAARDGRPDDAKAALSVTHMCKVGMEALLAEKALALRGGSNEEDDAVGDARASESAQGGPPELEGVAVPVEGSDRQALAVLPSSMAVAQAGGDLRRAHLTEAASNRATIAQRNAKKPRDAGEDPSAG